jgi:hypothetical protein
VASADEREFLPALRAIERSRRLAPQLAMLGRAHTALGGVALGAAALACALAVLGALFAGAPPPWLAGVGGGVALLLAALSAPWIALGYGLRRRRRWARGLGVVCGLALLPFAPLGTALGAWTLIVLAGWQPRLTDVAAD